MNTLRFTVNKDRLTAPLARGEPLSSNSTEYVECVFAFDEDWEEMAKTVVFYQDRSKMYHVPMVGEMIVVPWEALTAARPLHVGVKGTCGTVTIATNFVCIPVEEGVGEEGMVPEEPTQSVYDALNDAIASLQKQLDDMSYFAGIFAMSINEEGHLLVTCDDDGPVPPLSINDEGHLIYTIE